MDGKKIGKVIDLWMCDSKEYEKYHHNIIKLYDKIESVMALDLDVDGEETSIQIRVTEAEYPDSSMIKYFPTLVYGVENNDFNDYETIEQDQNETPFFKWHKSLEHIYEYLCDKAVEKYNLDELENMEEIRTKHFGKEEIER